MMEMAKLQGHSAGARSARGRAEALALHQGLALGRPGQGATVKLPTASQAIDWEAELGAVIGRTAKNVPLAKALDYVAGYTVANELSARDLGKRNQLPDSSPFKWDWVGQKCFDDACPLGPGIVPASDIKDPQKLGIKLWVNDVIKQDSNTSDMIFTLAEQIEQLSSRITLASRRHHPDRHAGGRRRRAARVPEGRRHHQGLGRERRHADQQDGLTRGFDASSTPARLRRDTARRYTADKQRIPFWGGYDASCCFGHLGNRARAVRERRGIAQAQAQAQQPGRPSRSRWSCR